jgi:VIT1/CCC1 family predicted Fe2+/Mn2+ transporter
VALGRALAASAPPPTPHGNTHMKHELFTPSTNELRQRLGYDLPDIIYGANDGLITTFAVVSGVIGGNLSWHVVLVLGFANLFADGVSMGASNFLARRSEGEGQPRVSRMVAARHGFVTFTSFVLIGAIPLFAFIGAPVESRFLATTVVTLVTLFTIGAMRATLTRVVWWRAGLEMLIVGAAAAAIAYGIGALIARIVVESNDSAPLAAAFCHL